MGKSIPSTTKLQEFAKIMASDKLQRSKRAKPISRIRVSSPESVKPGVVRVDSEKKKIMESSVAQQNQNQNRLPLAQVVSDCVKRWFQDTLKEAKAGDSAMQVLVGQMYSRGYGVPKDPFKGRSWYYRASQNRVSVWNVRDKHPGYNASDSDSDELKGEAK
jgi:hypothetical protein